MLAPTNTTHKPITLVPGGSAVLQPVPLPGHEDEEMADLPSPLSPGGRAAGAGAPGQAEAAPAAVPPLPQPELAPNPWLERLRTRQQAEAAAAAAAAADAGGAPPSPPAGEPSKPGAPAQHPVGSAQPQSVLVGWLSGDSGGSGSGFDLSSGDSAGSCCSEEAGGGEAGGSEQTSRRGGGGGGSEAQPMATEPAEQVAGGAQEPRAWSLWDSGSSPSLFDSLQTVVQEHLLQHATPAPAPAPATTPAPAVPETCYFQVGGLRQLGSGSGSGNGKSAAGGGGWCWCSGSVLAAAAVVKGRGRPGRGWLLCVIAGGATQGSPAQRPRAARSLHPCSPLCHRPFCSRAGAPGATGGAGGGWSLALCHRL